MIHGHFNVTYMESSLAGGLKDIKVRLHQVQSTSRKHGEYSANGAAGILA